MGTDRAYSYRVLGPDRFKPHLAVLVSVVVIVLAAVSGAPVPVLVVLGVFFASMTAVLAFVATSVDLDCARREITWGSAFRTGSLPVDSINAVDSAIWAFSIARIECDAGNVLVDFGQSKQFQDLVDLMQSLRPGRPIEVRGRPSEPRPSPRVRLVATAR